VKKMLHTSDYYFTAYIWAVLTRVQFIMAFDLWRCLRTQTTNIRFSSQQIPRFIKYQLFCWLSPFAQLIIVWAIRRFTLQKSLVECVICYDDTKQLVLLIFFIVDFAMMLTNFSFYICCLYYIRQTRSQVKSANKQTSSVTFYYKVCGRLFIMSEVNYTLLILVYYFDVIIIIICDQRRRRSIIYWKSV
jgi:hypothetical protein